MTTSAVDRTGGPTLTEQAGRWQTRLAELLLRYEIPGAQLGVLRMHPGAADEVLVLSEGVLNIETGVGVTDDTVFQIGSISKVWTATLVMRLVDEGLLDLHTPVVELLPELKLSDPEATRQVTLWHLLTHTSGIDGDLFSEEGRGDDVLERFVALLADVPQLFPPGTTWSYCNAGVVLAGRVIEKVTGQVWDEAIRERLFAPLGLPNTVTLPEEALLRRAAVGHLQGEEGEPVRIPVWNVPRSVGPAGGIMSSAADVLTFVRMHLADGVAADGVPLLRPETAALMRSEQMPMPPKVGGGDMAGSSWGLGWMRLNWGGVELVGHNGGTTGQASALRLLPAQGLAVVLLTNGGRHEEFCGQLLTELFDEIAGVEQPRLPTTPPAEQYAFEAARYVGVYANLSMRLGVAVADTGLLLQVGAPDATDFVMEFPLYALEEDVFVLSVPPDPEYAPITFGVLPDGRRFVHMSGRLLPEVA